MRKLTATWILLGLACAVSSCLDPNPQLTEAPPHHHSGAREGLDGDHQRCATMEVLQQNLQDDPSLARKLRDIDAQAQRFAKGGDIGVMSTPYEGVVTIPVVVNVLYNVRRPQENISDAQIQSQIDVLNRDFSATNADVGQTPQPFAGVVAGFDVQFTLAKVVRKVSYRDSWGYRDHMKLERRGGIAATEPTKFLNIWICKIGGGILGYAQFPGGDPATDGIVVAPQYFGTTGYLEAPYDKGRTATHEIGHWLNLRHIWGDGPCGVDDLVADTPDSDAPNFGCPAFPTVRCGNTLMTMNYMDYTDDACMFMFTQGQRTRSRALFASDGARRSFITAP